MEIDSMPENKLNISYNAEDILKLKNDFGVNGKEEMLKLAKSELDSDVKHHYLKTEVEYFDAVKSGKKKFEIRKNDRDFMVGDMVTLQMVDKGISCDAELPPFEIKYILYGGKYGLDKDYCIFCW